MLRFMLSIPVALALLLSYTPIYRYDHKIPTHQLLHIEFNSENVSYFYEHSVSPNQSKSEYYSGRGGGLGDLIGVLINAIAHGFEFIFGAIKFIFEGAYYIIKGLFDIISSIFSAIVDGVTWVFGKLGDIISSNPTVVYKTDIADLGEHALSLMSTPKRPRISIDVSIPSNETEYAEIFGRENLEGYNVEIVSNLEREFIQLSDEGFDSVYSSRSVKSPSEFYRTLESQEYDYSAVIGHNENGYFRFADGSSVSIEELSAECHKKGKFCIFLSCDSSDFVAGSSLGVGRRIKYSEGLSTIRTVSNLLSSINPSLMNHLELNNMINRSISDSLAFQKNRPRVKFVIVSTSGGTVVAGVIIEMDNSRENRNQ